MYSLGAAYDMTHLGHNIKSFWNVRNRDPLSLSLKPYILTKKKKKKKKRRYQSFMPRRPRPAGGIERSACPYVRMCVRLYVSPSVDQVTFLSKVESQDLLMVAGWYFIWRCISTAGIYKSHDLMAYILWSTDFGLWPDYQG